jgi:hypothetical protein
MNHLVGERSTKEWVRMTAHRHRKGIPDGPIDDSLYRPGRTLNEY